MAVTKNPPITVPADNMSPNLFHINLSSDSAITDKKTADFLTLPTEIRLEIFGLVFQYVSLVPIIYGGTGRRKCEYFQIDFPITHKCICKPFELQQLFYVNHQISAEATEVFYSRTVFRGGRVHLGNFLLGIGPDRRNRIRKIQMQIGGCSGTLSKETIDFLCTLQLRSVLLVSGVRDWRVLQRNLVLNGIERLATHADVMVQWSAKYRPQDPISENRIMKVEESTMWSCIQGSTDWDGGEVNRRILQRWCQEIQRFVDTDGNECSSFWSGAQGEIMLAKTWRKWVEVNRQLEEDFRSKQNNHRPEASIRSHCHQPLNEPGPNRLVGHAEQLHATT